MATALSGHGLREFTRPRKAVGVPPYAVNPFGRYLKQVSMRLGVSIILSITTKKERSDSHPKGIGNVASRRGLS
jgi:hypothetical protein